MGRPPGTTKAYWTDIDQFAIGILDYALVTSLDNPALLAAAACGMIAEPNERAVKTHSELSKAGWTIQSFDIKHSREGTVSRLTKKDKRVACETNRRILVATAIFIANHIPHQAGQMLPLIADMVPQEDILFRSFIASLRNAVTTDLPIEQCIVKLAPANPRTRSRFMKDKNAERMRASRAANGAKPRIGNLSVEKPWEMLGMSRRTWYAKGKPAC